MAKILVIDDDPNILNITALHLENNGHEVIKASNGKAGIESVESRPVDLVITDIFMPEKEGIETILELKSGYPDLKIIAISGGGTDGNTSYLESASALGADAVLEKPISKKVLIEAVSKVLALG